MDHLLALSWKLILLIKTVKAILEIQETVCIPQNQTFYHLGHSYSHFSSIFNLIKAAVAKLEFS